MMVPPDNNHVSPLFWTRNVRGEGRCINQTNRATQEDNQGQFFIKRLILSKLGDMSIKTTLKEKFIKYYSDFSEVFLYQYRISRWYFLSSFSKIFQEREALILSNPNQTERYFLISIYYLRSAAQMKGYQSERQTD